VAWLTDADLSLLQRVPPVLHGKLAALVRALGLPNHTRLRLLELILRYGAVPGRQACADALGQLDADTSRDIILGALSQGTPDVVAWAVQNLRRLDVSNALETLVELLDHSSPVVRDAARHELRDFDLHRVLELIDQWDRQTCRRAGRLLQKVDPYVVDKLRRELRSPVQWRRLRAARAAAAMDFHRHLVDELIQMLDDPSVAVRRTAVDVLASVPGEKVTAALANLKKDPNRRIREAVAQALAVQTRLPQPAGT